MRRGYVIAIAVAVVLFLVISALLARAFSANSAEQSALTTLVTDEAHGDTNAVIGDVTGCRSVPACRERARENVSSLAHPGSVSIIQIQPSTSFSIAGKRGFARVAWSVGGSLPIVQCVRVWRTGNVITGLHVQLHEVSRRIASDAPCPAHF